MRFADLSGRRIVVFGAGSEGLSAVRALATRGLARGAVLVEDDDVTRERAAARVACGPGTVPDVPVLGGAAGRAAIADAEVVVLSPGVPWRRDDVRVLLGDAALTNPMDLALSELADSERDVVAVTGSKGKSTTTALARHLLHLAGHDVEEGGNIGRPVLDLLDGVAAVLVIEASSYQASLVTTAPRYGALTALFPEHLDWHGDVETYVADKLRLFEGPALRRVAVNATDDRAVARTRSLPCTPYGTADAVHHRDGRLFHGARRLTSVVPQLVGDHNLLNAAGALTAAAFVDPGVLDRPELLDEWLATFHPLPHRLETVARAGGVEYVDDSIATSPDATIAALDAFADRPVTLLAGGHDRSLPFDGLAAALVRRDAPTLVLTMPTSGGRLADLLDAAPRAAHVEVERCESLADAVARAVERTPDGGVVLLSPAAASYDRFTSYVHRGAEFRRLVLDAVSA
jgi:UDP-N-acetylmuramoylalanine--D-glutamate ligase